MINYNCPFCNKKYKVLQTLTKHCKKIHNIEKLEVLKAINYPLNICKCGNIILSNWKKYCCKECALKGLKKNIKNFWENVDENFIINRSNKTKLTNESKSSEEKKNIIDKIMSTRFKKHGVLSPVHFKKYKENSIKKYGVEFAWHSKESKEKQSKTRKLKTFARLIRFSERVIPNFSQEEFISVSHIHEWKCVICNNIFEDHCHSHIPRCPNCFKRVGVRQDELFYFLKKLYCKEMYSNDRKIISPKELDIYIPDMKLAFEFNGLWCHTEKKIHSNYHLEKTMLCQEQGIRLIHVWQDDWDEKRPIIESRIRSLFGQNEKIMARKCHITKINNEDARLFLNENHLQGSINAKYSYGLYYQGELVAVATFGKNRFKKDETELIRYCSKLGTNVMGGLSKLCKHFMKENHVNEIISYCSRDWGDGQGYIAAGFKQVDITSPNYWYVGPGNDWTRESRYKYQKHKLLKMWPDIDPSLTEHEIMAIKGFDKIYDTGNIKYQLNNNGNNI